MHIWIYNKTKLSNTNYKLNVKSKMQYSFDIA